MGAPVSAWRRAAPAMWSMCAWVMRICLTVSLCRWRTARMRGISSPGSTTMASPDASSPRMEQLHCSAPAGRTSWIMVNLRRPRRAGRQPELLLRRGLLGGGAGEDGAVAAGAREHHGERDGEDHEEHRAPGGELGEQVGRATRAKRRLRTLAAERAGEVGGFALLQQHNADQKQTDDDVNHNQNIEHREFLM